MPCEKENEAFTVLTEIKATINDYDGWKSLKPAVMPVIKSFSNVLYNSQNIMFLSTLRGFIKAESSMKSIVDFQCR